MESHDIGLKADDSSSDGPWPTRASKGLHTVFRLRVLAHEDLQNLQVLHQEERLSHGRWGQSVAVVNREAYRRTPDAHLVRRSYLLEGQQDLLADRDILTPRMSNSCTSAGKSG